MSVMPNALAIVACTSSTERPFMASTWPCFKKPTGVAHQQPEQLVGFVSVRVAELRDPKHDRVVEHGAGTFWDGVELSKQVRELLRVHRRQQCYPYKTFAAPATTRPHQQEAERLTESTLCAPCLSVHAQGEIGRTYFTFCSSRFETCMLSG